MPAFGPKRTFPRGPVRVRTCSRNNCTDGVKVTATTGNRRPNFTGSASVRRDTDATATLYRRRHPMNLQRRQLLFLAASVAFPAIPDIARGQTYPADRTRPR